MHFRIRFFARIAVCLDLYNQKQIVMKKILLTLTLSISAFIIANAQTEKGDWMVGGGFRLNTSDNNTEIALTPNAGAFVINNLALGGNLGFAYVKSGDTKVTSFGIGPFVRYYFTNANVRPIFHGTLIS